jgi:hypothetical protein
MIFIKEPPIPQCPYCGEAVQIRGDEDGINYYWCSACRYIVEPLNEPPKPKRQIIVRKGILAAWNKRKFSGRGNGRSGAPHG